MHVKIVKYFILFLSVVGLALQVQAGNVSFKNLPHEGSSVDDFIPMGWKVDLKVSGDLNGDGVPDVAAILIEDKPDSDQSDADEGFKRAFIVLLSTDNSKFVLAGSNDKLLQCKGCGGVKEFVDIEIKKGILIVSQMSGSREYTYNIWRFRFESKSQRFVLIGMDSEEGDNVLRKKKIESSNYLTKLKVVQDGKKTTTSSMKETNPSQQTLFLEDVAE